MDEKKKKAVLSHPNKLGAGAAKRRRLLHTPQEVMEAVMAEQKKGTLHSGSGDIVKNRKQAIAIGLAEARKKGKK